MMMHLKIRSSFEMRIARWTLLLSALLMWSSSGFGQSYISGSPSQGCPSSVNGSYTFNYTDSDGFLCSEPSWSITGGSVSPAYNGMTATATWTATGSLRVDYCVGLYSGGNASRYTLYYFTMTSSPNAGTISATATAVCTGGGITLSVSGNNGGVTWQKCTSGAGCGVSNDTGWSTTTTTQSNMTITTKFRAKLSNICGTSYSNVVNVTVSQPPTAANAGPDQTGSATCGLTTVSLAGNAPSIGTGLWSVVSGAGGSFGNASSPTSTFSGTAGSTYTLRWTISNSPCTASADDVTITFNTLSVGGTLGSDVEAYGIASGQLQLQNFNGTVQRWWQKVGEGSWVDIGGTTSTLPYTNITTTTSYKAEVKSGACLAVNSSEKRIIIHAVPSLTIQGPSTIAPGGSTTLITSSGMFLYQWYMEGALMATETQNRLTVRKPAVYHVSVKATSTAPTYTTGNVVISDGVSNQSAMNYILSTTFLKPGITAQTDPYSLQHDELSQSVQYFDGIGRPIQGVTIGASPKGNDIIQPIAYDQYGREPIKYLPYVASSRDGRYISTAVTAQDNFYQSADKVAHDVDPFAQTVFEPSPLNRILKQGSPGNLWKPDASPYSNPTDHAIYYAYESNVAADVLLWTCSLPSNDTALWIANGSATTKYGANQLFKSKTKDEDQHELIEYKDKLGRVVLKSVQGPSASWAHTYYIYDDLGNLVIVLPPEATQRLSNEYFGMAETAKDSFLRRWAFRYRYDDRNRMILKQVPGANAVFLVYDGRDRLVLTQDGNQRALAINEWIFTKYDAFNRPVMTGIFKDSQNRNQQTMQSFVNTFYTNATPEKWYDQEGTIVHGYTNRSFPDVSAAGDYNTVTYYDNYNFRDNYAGADYEYTPNDLPGQMTAPFGRVYGKVTGTKTRVLGTPDFLWGITYYDDRNRPIQTKSQNHKGGIDRTTSLYDFSGKVINVKTEHTSTNLGDLTTIQDHKYDHAGRVKRVYHTIVEKVNWTNKVNTVVENGVLRKNAGTEAWNAGAFSENTIPAGEDGWVEFKVTDTNTYRMLGLSDQDTDVVFNTIDFAMYLEAGGSLTIYEGGAYKGLYAYYSTSDIFRIERKDGNIVYKRNGVTLYTSQATSSSALHADASMLTLNTTIANATIGLSSIEIVQNEYNELGQLIGKTLVGAPRNYLQSVDFRYNIRGWLTSINNAQLANDALTNDDSDDLFGMELLYNATDAGMGNTGLFNGNISAVKWKTPVYGSAAVDDRKGYVFQYDPMNRLTQAAYAGSTAVGQWTAEVNAFNEALTYDLNGNIQTLQRNKAKAGSSAFSIAADQIDNLDYNYDNTTYPTGNQLRQVQDLTLKEAGFKNGSSDPDEFRYDKNGNMNRDLNKGINSITYNHLNLPSLITFANGNTIQYTYDAAGVKLRQTVTEGGGTKTTDYVGSIVYERDTLRFMSIPEGRIVNNNGDFEYQFMLKDHLGNTRVLYGNPFEGNNLVSNADCNNLGYFGTEQNVTRTQATIDGETYMKFVSNQETSTPGMITFGFIYVKPGEKYTFKVKGFGETPDPAFLYVWSNTSELVWPGVSLPFGKESETWVSNDFTVPEGTDRILLGVLWRESAGLDVGATFYLNEIALYKHKDDDHVAGFEVSSQGSEALQFSNYHTNRINNTGAYSRTGSSAYRLTGSTQVSNEVIGPAKSIRVYPGDAVHMEVYGKYLTTTGGGTNVAGVIASALQGAFSLTAGGATDVAYQSISNLFGGGPLIGTAAFPEEDGVPPKAFLNYILFDDDYVPYDFGYDQISTAGALPGGVDKMDLVAKVRKPGYIYIYLSNENEVAQEVYFDDLAIKHVKGVAIQENDYYPFGLTFNSYQRENSLDQKYLYNGKEIQDELSLGTYDFHARMYDPAVARTFQQDPMSAMYYAFSPYSWAANNPIVFIDPTGMVIEEGSQKEWDKQKGYVEGRRDKLEARKEGLNAKAEKKGWSNEKLARKMGNVNERISSLSGTLGTMTELENSAQTYSLKPGDTSGAGGITYDTNTGNVVLAYNGTANFVHEVTHGGQFEAGHMAFSSTTGKSYGQDLVDEVSAYKAQFAYSPSSVSGLKSSISARSFGDITTGWVKNIVSGDGSKIYAPGGSANTGQAQIHINSTRADFMRAYPGMAAKLMGPRTDTMKNFISDMVVAPFGYNGY